MTNSASTRSKQFYLGARFAFCAAVLAAMAGCASEGGEITVAPTQDPLYTKGEPGNVEATGGVDILRYRPPSSEVPDGVRSRPVR